MQTDFETVKFTILVLGSLITSLTTLAVVYLRLVINNAMGKTTIALRDLMEKRYISRREADSRYRDLNNRIRALESSAQ